MTQAYIQVVPDSTGKKLVTNTIDPGVETLHQQRVELADATGTPLAGASGSDGSAPQGLMSHGLVDDSPPQYTAGERRPVSLTQDGRMRVSLEAPDVDFFGDSPWDGGLKFSGVKYV